MNPRSEWRVRNLRALVAQRDNWTCYRCGQPIDPTLRHPHRYSATLEHVLPEGVTLAIWTATGHDPYDPNTCSVSHRTCNLTAGASLGGHRVHHTTHTTTLNTSRAW